MPFGASWGCTVQSMKIKIKPFTGTWVIVELGAWDQEYVNMEVSGYWILHVQEKWHGTFSFRTGPGRDGLLYGNRRREGADRIFLGVTR